MRIDSDRQVVLLLTAYFGSAPKDGPKPLGPKEWGEFARWLHDAGHRPGALLNGDASTILEEWAHSRITRERIQQLLDRGSAMALALEKWERAGIWVMTRSDTDYPSRLKRRLGSSAPPLLFGCGSRELLEHGGVAIVGSRGATAEDLDFTRRLAASVGQCGYSVVSGGARGVDEAAMLGALEAEGTVIGVLADNLMRAVTSSKYRKALRSKDLVLISPFKPDGRFQVGNAMARNKYIYCLADAAVVIACEEGSGGTWSGATETLRNSWVPVWVKAADTATSGNLKLQEIGAQPLPLGEADPSLLIEASPSNNVEGYGAPGSNAPETSDLITVESTLEDLSDSGATGTDLAKELSLYGLFLLQLESHISAAPASIKEIQEMVGLEAQQTKVWVARAEDEGKIVKETKRPARYQWISEETSQTTLF